MSIFDILYRKFFLCNRVFVRLCVTAVSTSTSHLGNRIECFLPPKYAMRCLGTEADNVVSQLDKGSQKAVAWENWYACAVEKVGFQGCKAGALPEH